jgi:proteasome lid subunit RPN8/RPN11
VAFDDTAVAEFFDEQVDAGRRPEQFARIWVHTHPGECPWPSGVDERTFADAFGHCDWSVMFILARGGQTYARLQFRAGPGAQVRWPA